MISAPGHATPSAQVLQPLGEAPNPWCSNERVGVQMLGTWWFFWLAFMFIFLLPPVGYGWGYRGWGPPYPRHIQRRRGEAAALTGGPNEFNPHSWGWGGDF